VRPPHDNADADLAFDVVRLACVGIPQRTSMVDRKSRASPMPHGCGPQTVGRSTIPFGTRLARKSPERSQIPDYDLAERRGARIPDTLVQ
jgi:hypothetical protein